MPKKIDLIGHRVGHLTVTGVTEERENHYRVWSCRCDCGREILVNTKRLQSGTVTDCGCIPKTSAHKGNVAEDLTGRVFGYLTVIRRMPNKKGRTCWLCRCECGREKEVFARDLKAGKVKSCGCLMHKREYKRTDLTGQRFGRLMAKEPTERRDRNGSIYWRCICDCGNEAEVTESALVGGNCLSCGCLKRENQKE